MDEAAVTARRYEFASLMRPGGAAAVISPRTFRRDRFALFPGVLNSVATAPLVRALDRRMFPLLQTMAAPIPADTITGMKWNYHERLPKVMRVRTAQLNGRSRAAALAETLGVLPLIRSESLARFAEQISGFRLERPCSAQVICYTPGDYSGPHNDHHPEDPELRNGYVDLQITLVNNGVASQHLVYEKAGHLTEMADISRNGSVALYYLPFWHYTTPMMARPGFEARARRWLLLSSFQITP